MDPMVPRMATYATHGSTGTSLLRIGTGVIRSTSKYGVPSDRKSKQQWLTFEHGLLACIRVGCCLHLRGTTSARRDAHEDDMQIVTRLDAQRTASTLMRILLMTTTNDDVYDDVELVRLRSASPGDVGDFGQS